MIRDRLFDVIKGATEVNLRYSAITLRLAKEYIKEFDGMVRNGVTGKGEVDGDGDGRPDGPTPERRPPLLLVGRAGEEAGGAFILNNSADTELAVNLIVQGDIAPVQADLVPDSFVIAPGDHAVVQLKAIVTEAMETGRDYAGVVIAPGLSAQTIDFVVRRLPGEAPAPRRKARRRAAG
jgi:fructose-specific component phosphotransferase system IIB-like protein